MDEISMVFQLLTKLEPPTRHDFTFYGMAPKSEHIQITIFSFLETHL